MHSLVLLAALAACDCSPCLCADCECDRFVSAPSQCPGGVCQVPQVRYAPAPRYIPPVPAQACANGQCGVETAPPVRTYRRPVRRVFHFRLFRR